MSWFERLAGSRTARVVWGLVALAAAALLAVSFGFAAKGVRGGEEAAQSRAVAVTNTVLYDSLTPAMVNKPMLTQDYRALMSAVGAGILSDDRVARVRIWRTDGTLAFSSDQRDKIRQYVATGDRQLQVAGSGATVSLLTGATVLPEAGLAGSEEQLYETFVPLHLAGEDGVSGVAEIDQRYSAIRGAVTRVWFPAQIGLGILALFAVVSFALSFRTGRRRGRAPTRAPAPRLAVREEAEVSFASMEAAAELTRTKEALRQVEERARTAERAIKERDPAGADEKHLQDRLASSERRLQEAIDAYRRLDVESKRATVRVPELEAEVNRLKEAASAVPAATEAGDAQLAERLRATDEQRLRLAGEAQRLRSALAEREAELALARASAETGAEETTKTDEQARQAAERIAQLEDRAREGEQRALAAEQRAVHAEEQLRVRDSAFAVLEAESKQTNEATERRAEAELRRAEQEVEQVSLRLRETEAALGDASTRAASLEAAARQMEDDRRGAAAEMDRLSTSLAERQTVLTEREAELERLRDSLAAREAELERLRDSLAAKEAEVEAESGDARARIAELETRVREFEEQRRLDVSELQRAQETLANTQFELTQAAGRARDAEGRLRQLEAEGATRFEPEEPTLVPEPDVARVLEPDHAGLFLADGPAGLEPEYVPEEATIASRLARILPRRHERDPEPGSEPEREPAQPTAATPVEAEDEPPAPQPSEEGLSLRERLTRAAAARHRVSGPESPPES